MADYLFPSNAELQQISQTKIPNLVAARPIFDIMPLRNVDSSVLMWEQLDNYTGLQQIRGINGEAPRVKAIGLKRYLMQPGVYGEFTLIDERELLERRTPGTFGTPINIEDLVMQKQDQLLGRRLDRIELIGWTLVGSGTFSVNDPSGLLSHTDTFPIQTYTAATTWATSASATPLLDFRSVQLKQRGYSVTFGADSKAYMNLITFNNLISNTNNADLYGRRTTGLATVNSPQALNQLLSGDNLPTIVIYDEGYLDDTGAFQAFIPNGTVILVGKRPAGQVVAEYLMTRNASNPNMAPGPYQRVFDRGVDTIPRKIEIHDGHSGGPVIYYPSAIVKLAV